MNTSKILHVGSRIRIEPDLVLMIKAESNYSMVYMIDGTKFLTSTTLKIIESRLEITQSFLRVDRSFLINKTYLKKRINNKFFLVNNEQFIMSRRKLKKFFPNELPVKS